jgi:hypothetical protein
MGGLAESFLHIARDSIRQLLVMRRHDSQMIAGDGFYLELSCQASPNSTWIGWKVREGLGSDEADLPG